MDAVNTYVIAAARMALDDSALDDDQRRACGILVGTGFAGLTSVVKHQRRFMEEGIEKLSPIHFPTTVYNASAGLAAIELGLTGPNTTVTGVDVPAEYALLYAALMLRGGMASHLVLVGADELGEALMQGFADLGLLAGDPGAAGFVPGEGAGALVLELEETARARGAGVLGTVEGIGAGSAASKPFDYAPGAAHAVVEQALRQADLGREAIAWFSVGRNGSPSLTRAEASAFEGLIDDRPVAALKHFTGEFAGSGMLRLVLGLSCARAGFVPAVDGAMEQGADRPFLHLGLGVGGNATAAVVRPAA
jgi:3-oxoacyl-(acyl-carrier-protein) synthase